MLLKYTLKNLLRHPWRTVATVLGVALGIAAVLGTVTVGDNINANLSRVFSQAVGQSELIIAPSASARAVISLADAQKLASTAPAVRQTLPTLEYYAVLKRKAKGYVRPLIPGMQGGFLLSGQDTAQPETLGLRLEGGTLPLSGSSGIAITQAFALREKLKVGDPLEFVSAIGRLEFKVSGFLRSDNGLANLNAGQVGVVNLADLQKATYLQGKVSYLGLALNTGSDAEAVKTTLEAKIPTSLEMLYPAGRGQISNGLIQTVQSGLQVLAATLMALAGFLAYNTFAAAVVERSREFALLRTLGFTKNQVLRMGMLEAGLVSIMGIGVGVLLGAGIATAITAFNAYLLEFPFLMLVMPWNKVLLAAGVGTITAFVAASGPARAASRVAPIVAAREAYVAGSSRVPIWGWLSLILGLGLSFFSWPSSIALLISSLSMAFTFLGIALVSPVLLAPASKLLEPLLLRTLGIPAKLGLSSALRSKGRNGVAIGAVALGMGLIVGVGGMVAGINNSLSSWVNGTIIGDMFVAAAAPFPDNFEQDLRQRFPQLTETAPVAVRVARFQPPQGRARNASAIFTSPDRYTPGKGTGKLQFLEGDMNSSLTLFGAGKNVFISGTIADRYGLHKGNPIKIRTLQGWLEFRILGVIVDYTSAGESVVFNLKDLALFDQGKPELYVLSLPKGQDLGQIKAFGAQLTTSYPKLFLDIQYNQNYKDLILKITSQFFGSTNSLLALSVIVAAMGVANTLGMNLVERSHEMALLRALGFTRRELMRSVFAEGILVVVVGTILGLSAGAALSRVITAAANSLTGYRVEPTFPLELMLVALLSSPVVGILAAFLPARKATQASPAAALRSSE